MVDVLNLQAKLEEVGGTRKDRIRLEPYMRAPEWKMILLDRVIHWLSRIKKVWTR